MNFNRISRLCNFLTEDLKRKPTVILDPNQNRNVNVHGTADNISIGLDTEKWIISPQLYSFIKSLSLNDNTFEENVIKIYEKICKDYIYDDNVLSYIQKNDDDTFFLPDSYGRRTSDTWKRNREKHNRRSCFEVSRILAESITELAKRTGNAENYDICIMWDEAVTHYFVGLTSRDYCVSLDLDDFTQIKDITRLKTDLTLEGIKIYHDNSGKFYDALEKYNFGRSKNAKFSIKDRDNIFKQTLCTPDRNHYPRATNDNSIAYQNRQIAFLQNAIQILIEEYDLDSTGIFEYMKEIVDTTLGARLRKKVWKEVKTTPGTGKQFTRCLVVVIDSKPYLIDVTKDNPSEMIIELTPEILQNQEIISFNEMHRDWKDDPYDGR